MSRQQVLCDLTNHLLKSARNLRGRPLLVAIDGRTASGKTTLTRELHAALQEDGQHVYSAAIDDFHHPRAIRYRQGKGSSKGYYEDARDLDLCRTLLLDPLQPGGSRTVALKGFDLKTDLPLNPKFIDLPEDAIVLVEGTFLQRPELSGCWDIVIFVHVSKALSIARGSQRDARVMGQDLKELEERYTNRYAAAFEHYREQVDPEARADFILDHTDICAPTLDHRKLTYHIMCAQMENSTDQAHNLAVMLKLLDLAASHDADVVVFPECALTGFHSKPEPCTPDELEPLVDTLHTRAMAHRQSVVLPSIIDEGDRVLNSGWFLSARGDRTRFTKRGLTESERRFFTAPDDTPTRTFSHRELRLGLLICREIADDPGAYFEAQDVDLVLWPTYWRWDDDFEWGHTQGGELATAAYTASTHWSVPLCQANYAANAHGDSRDTGPSGLSVVIDAHHTHLTSGKAHAVGMVQVTLHHAHSDTVSTMWHDLIR